MKGRSAARLLPCLWSVTRQLPDRFSKRELACAVRVMLFDVPSSLQIAQPHRKSQIEAAGRVRCGCG